MKKAAVAREIGVLVAALTVASLAYAGPGGHRPSDVGGRWQGRGGMMRGLQLEEKQQDKLLEMKRENMQQMRSYRQSLREKRQELARALTSDNIDVSKAEALVDEIVSIQKKMLKARVRHMKQLRELLGPEKYREFIYRVQNRRRGHMRNNRWQGGNDWDGDGDWHRGPGGRRMDGMRGGMMGPMYDDDMDYGYDED